MGEIIYMKLIRMGGWVVSYKKNLELRFQAGHHNLPYQLNTYSLSI